VISLSNLLLLLLHRMTMTSTTGRRMSQMMTTEASVLVWHMFG
jgi:hypothetical protein